MKFHHAGLAAAALLLVAAQDAPNPPSEGASFSEAFAEQSNAAKAGETAEKLDAPAEAVEPSTEPAAASTPEPEAKPTEAVEAAPDPATASSDQAEAAEAAPAAAVEASHDAAEPLAAPAEEPGPEGLPKLAKGDPVTRDFLVGVWVEPGKSCEAGIDFQADGRMIGPFPRWELNEGELTMVGNRQKMRLTVVDKNTMQSRRSETDPPRTLKRCLKDPTPPKP